MSRMNVRIYNSKQKNDKLENLRIKWLTKTENGNGDNKPPVLKLAPSGDNDEKRAIANLLSAGYTVSVIDPYAENFNEKYSVFQDFPIIGKRIVIVDELGNVIGFQG